MRDATKELQLQFWSRAAGMYIPASACEAIGTKAARDLPRIGRQMSAGRGWRVVRADRPLKPRYIAPRFSAGRTVAQVQADYGDWARAQGLKQITAYRGRSLHLGGFGGTIRYITLEEHFKVTELREVSREHNNMEARV